MITFEWEENDAKKKFATFEKSGSVSWAIIDLTEACNFRCKWCFANAGGIRDPHSMGLGTLESLIGVLAGLGVRQVTFSGGEPTLYPHLREAVSIARDSGMVVHMNTNGFLLTKRLAKDLASAGLSQVQINIDSVSPEKHDCVRGMAGSFARSLQALENARNAGMTCVSETVLTSDNEGEIEDVFRLARRLRIGRLRVWDMTPSRGRARGNADLLPKNYLGVLQRMADFAQENGARSIEVGDPIFIHHVRTQLPVSGGYCAFARGMIMYISVRGDVFFCCTMRDRMYNIFEQIDKGQDLAGVHRREIARYLKGFPVPERCGSCAAADSCAGGCLTRRDFSGHGADYLCAGIPVPRADGGAGGHAEMSK